MDNYKRSTSIMSVFFMPMFLFLLSIFILAGIYSISMELEKESKYNDYIHITSTIVEINEKSEDEKITVIYEVDNVVYTIGLQYYLITLSVGDEIELMYNPSSPTDIVLVTKGLYVGPIVFLSIGIIGSLICIYVMYCNKKNLNKLKKIMINNSYEELIIKGYMKSNPYAKANTIVGKYIICDDNNGNSYLSNLMYISPSKFKIDTKIKLYIDKNNSNLFYIDTISYLKNKKM